MHSHAEKLIFFTQNQYFAVISLYPCKSVFPTCLWEPLELKKNTAVTQKDSPLNDFLMIWEAREVPANWKLFRKSKKDDPGNYRSVNVTSMTITEKLIWGGIKNT